MARGDGVTMEADDRLRWLLGTGLLHDVYSRHEVFVLLEKWFPEGSPGVKAEIWEEGMRTYRELLTDRPLEPTFAVWIARVDPGFGPAEEVLEAFRTDHPEWTPSEHPEFLTYIGEVRVIPPKALPEELGEHPTFEALRAIEMSDRSPFAASTLQDAVAASVRVNPEAGVEILEAIAHAGAWDTVLWDGVRYGLERASAIRENLWPRLLAVAGLHEDPHHALETLSRILLAGVRSDPPQIGSVLFGLAAETLSTQLGRVVGTGADVADPGDDIVFTALNSWPGEASQYLIATAARTEKEGEDPCTVPGLAEYLRTVSDSSPSNWARVAVTVLARDFPYLWERCPGLVELTLLRAFDWSEPSMAAAAWEGIAYARWSCQTVDALNPVLPEMVTHLGELSDNARRGLTGTLASIATSYDTETPAPPDWIDALIATNADQTRSDFAHAMRRSLEATDAPARNDLWTRWLRSWLERRREGFPVPIDQLEGSMILSWTIPLSDCLAEVLPLALELPLAPQTWGYLHDLRDSDLPDTNPTETVKLVAHVLRQRDQLYDRDIVINILERASAAGASHEAMLEACNAIAALGQEPPGFCL